MKRHRYSVVENDADVTRLICRLDDNEACVLFKGPSTKAPAIPVVAADLPGTGTPLSGGGGLETSGISDKSLGLDVFIGVVLVSLVGERRRVTSSATRVTNSSNIPGEREMG